MCDSINNKDKEKNKWFNWGLFITLFVNSIVGIGGLCAVDYFSKSRDILNKKREVQLEYLIKSYRAIETLSGMAPQGVGTKEVSDKEIEFIEEVEHAIADIQLFGSIQQIKAIQDICKKAGTPTLMKTENDLAVVSYRWEADELLLDLRRELRKELGLPEINPIEDKQNGIAWLRLSQMIKKERGKKQ